MLEKIGSDKEQRNSNLQAEYKEVCNNFRMLTDIRFKLLALLPISTAAGVSLTINQTSVVNSAMIGLFGLAITSCIAMYDMRNDQLYNELVARAAELERHLRLKNGSFAHRPRPWRRIGLLPVQHGQVKSIYWTSMVAWLFLVLYNRPPEFDAFMRLPSRPSPPNIFAISIDLLIAVTIMSLAAFVIMWQRDRSARILRSSAKKSVCILMRIPISDDPRRELDPCLRWLWNAFLKEISTLGGSSVKEIEKHLLFYLSDKSRFYWDRPFDKGFCDGPEAAQLVGLVSNMPARWIFDVASGRR